jgi:Protein of unknown function (DUF2852)
VTTISTNVVPHQAARRAPHLAVQILGLLAFTGFAIVTTVMAFVMFWLAGVVLTLAFVWFGFRPLLGQRHMQADAGADMGMDTAPHVTMPIQRSGNGSFDAYRDNVLRRLEEEQVSFDGFLTRLRDAKDSREFDAFMEDRARSNREATVVEDAPKRGEY